MGDIIFYLAEWMQPTYYRGGFSQDDMCAFAEWYHQKREQERQRPSPDRDELAMTMPEHHYPSIADRKMFFNICDHFEIEYNESDQVSCIKASLEYDARVRYMYADAMLKARKV